MASNRRGGIIYLRVNGTLYDVKGNWSYNLGRPQRVSIMGADSIHGYSEQPQEPMIEGAITDKGDLDLNDLVTLDDATVVLELANGKTISLRNAWFAGEGTASTEEGEIAVKFVGLSADEA